MATMVAKGPSVSSSDEAELLECRKQYSLQPMLDFQNLLLRGTM